MEERKAIDLNRIRGCLIGGAAGDALGYPVEFLPEGRLRSQFGSSGITSYVIDDASGKALISDDTQMTLFTADGVLFGATRGYLRGVGAAPSFYVSLAYHDWLWTQEHEFGDKPERHVSWLLDVPELYSRRAPGTTCISAMKSRKWGDSDRFIEPPINNSKGCGGIMRVAPIGLLPVNRPAYEAAEVAAITHGHPFGYLSAAVLAQLIHLIVFDGCCLEDAIYEAYNEVSEAFRGNGYLDDLLGKLNQAARLAENDRPDSENILELGEGWVAEETLAIAVYCSLRHRDSFSEGIIAAVNHSGDSDSTGSVTGNILGAYLGYDAIEEKWKKDLELSDVILEIADDIANENPFIDDFSCQPDWDRKYVLCEWTGRK